MRFADWTDHMRESLLNDMNRHFQGIPDFISLAGGLPDPALIPNEALAQAAHEVLINEPNALQYGRDLPGLKAHIADFMQERGVTCAPEQVTITAGGQQGMDIFTRLFLNPGGQVMLEELAYTGIQQAIMPFMPEILTVPVSPVHGIDLDALEAQLAAGAKPAFLYIVAAAHNPLGVTLQIEQRQRLMKLARQYEMPVVEDDAYGFLEYDDKPIPALNAIDPDWAFYIGSFAKILAPGIRMGWVITPRSHLSQNDAVDQAAIGPLDITRWPSTSSIAILIKTTLRPISPHLRSAYGKRRDVMMDAIAEHFPAEVISHRPSGGMFVWSELPDGFDALEVIKTAAQQAAVGCIPGKAFVCNPAHMDRFERYMRLTFVRYGEEVIVEGVARLGGVLKDVLYAQKSI